MAAPKIQQVMDGVRDRLLTITGLRADSFSPGQINPPHAIVDVPGIPNYHLTMTKGLFQIDVTVTLLVQVGDTRAAQQALVGYADPSGAGSVVAAIEAERTLGGTASDCVVDSYERLGDEQVAAIGYFGGQWRVRVYAPAA